MRGCSTGLRAFDGVEVCVFAMVASYEQVSKRYVHEMKTFRLFSCTFR